MPAAAPPPTPNSAVTGPLVRPPAMPVRTSASRKGADVRDLTSRCYTGGCRPASSAGTHGRTPRRGDTVVSIVEGGGNFWNAKTGRVHQSGRKGDSGHGRMPTQSVSMDFEDGAESVVSRQRGSWQGITYAEQAWCPNPIRMVCPYCVGVLLCSGFLHLAPSTTL